jgi:hypothetical protein
VATLFCAAWNKPSALGIVAFLFTESYHGAVVIGLIVVAVVAAQALHDRQVRTRLVFASIVGVAAGLLLSPWFPANVRYMLFHTVFKTTQASMALVGNEWLPVTWMHILLESWPAHAILASGLAMATMAARRDARGWRVVAPDTLAALAISVAFLAMYKFGWRFVEYYAPFAVLSAALAWRDALVADTPARRPLRQRGLAAVLVALIALGMWVGGQRVGSALTNRFDAYADMMKYVEAHDPQPMVFNASWSDFQQMFYWADRARFVAGLDGHYLLYGDLERFRLWHAFTTGEAASREGNAHAIRTAFNARWVVLPRGYARMSEALSRDPDARLVISTADGFLFELR